VGRLIAESLGMNFIDSDVELVNRTKRTITEIVESEGWGVFREMEKNIIKELSEKKGIVIATGGGVVLNKENVTFMKKTGIIVWLRATTSTIKERMEKDEVSNGLRPALTIKGNVEEVEETLSFRYPLYEKAKDFYVDTDYSDINVVSRDIIKILKTLRGNL